MSVKIYTASAMTGRSRDELLDQSYFVQQVMAMRGITVLDPIAAEGIKPSGAKLLNTHEDLAKYWRRDKEMIREAHVVLDVTGPAKSEGVAHEIGYARYFLWKPVVRVWPKLGPSVAHFEDDVIVNDVFEAAFVIERYWGSFWKRLKWRLKMLNRCFIKFILFQLGEFK